MKTKEELNVLREEEAMKKEEHLLKDNALSDDELEKVAGGNPSDLGAGGWRSYHCMLCQHDFIAPSFPKCCPKCGCTAILI